jgi:uncharacterized protein affecting Mg2+/Co2+ transport
MEDDKGQRFLVTIPTFRLAVPGILQ